MSESQSQEVRRGNAGASWQEARSGLREHPSTTIDFQQYGADVNRATVTLLGCRALLLSRFEVAPCATLSLEHLAARGTGTHTRARTAHATWLSPGLGVQARAYMAPWLSLMIGLNGELETSRPQLSLDGLGHVTGLFPAAGTITVGSEWIFLTDCAAWRQCIRG